MQHAAGNLLGQKTPNDGQIVNQRRWRQTTFRTQKSRELANKLTHGTRIHFQRRRLNATEITQISEQLLAGGHVAAPLPAAMILVKLAKTRLVEPVQRKPTHFEPTAEIRHEHTLCLHRVRGITPAAEQCSESTNVRRQWARAGLGGWRGYGAVPINHRPSPQSSGKIP